MLRVIPIAFCLFLLFTLAQPAEASKKGRLAKLAQCLVELLSRGEAEPSELDDILLMHWEDKSVYEPGRCFDNSGELFRILARFPDTDVDLSQVKILVLLKKNQDPKGKLDREENGIMYMAAGRGKGRTVALHAFLYYQGRVWDLDYKFTGASFYEYHSTMFPIKVIELENEETGTRSVRQLNHPEDLKVGVVAASDYLSAFPKTRPLNSNPDEKTRLKALFGNASYSSLEDFYVNFAIPDSME